MDQITRAILDTVQCVGGETGVVYVTVPITSGVREFRLMKELNISRDLLRDHHRDKWIEQVVRPNISDAEAYSLMAKLQFPQRLVLNPAPLKVDDWDQSQYNAMWKEVLRKYCDLLVLTPDWAFSLGARREVEEMLLLGRRIVDIFGRPVRSQTLNDQMSYADESLRQSGWSDTEIETVLPRIVVTDVHTSIGKISPHAPWDEAFEWMLNERRWQRAIPDFKDDERTRSDGPKCAGGEWERKLQKYWAMAINDEIRSELGGIRLLQFVTLCVAMMESVARVYGSFPEPGVSRGEAIREGRLDSGEMDDHQLFATTLAWLRREYFYTIEKYDSRDDDNNTRSGLNWWDRQLKTYWTNMKREGLDTLRGRQALGKYTSTAINLATSRIRLYGSVAPAERLPAEEVEFRRRLREGDLRAEELFKSDEL